MRAGGGLGGLRRLQFLDGGYGMWPEWEIRCDKISGGPWATALLRPAASAQNLSVECLQARSYNPVYPSGRSPGHLCNSGSLLRRGAVPPITESELHPQLLCPTSTAASSHCTSGSMCTTASFRPASPYMLTASSRPFNPFTTLLRVFSKPAQAPLQPQCRIPPTLETRCHRRKMSS